MKWLDDHRLLESKAAAEAFLERSLCSSRLYISLADANAGTFPSLALSAFYESAPATTQHSLRCASAGLLARWLETPPTNSEILDELVYLVAAIRAVEAESVILGYVNGRSKPRPSERNLHARLLGALLDLQKRSDHAPKDASFWLRQFARIGSEYVAVVWAGMLQSDVDEAFALLSGIVRSRQSTLKVRLILPWLVAEGLVRDHHEICDRLLFVSKDLKPSVKRTLDELMSDFCGQGTRNPKPGGGKNVKPIPVRSCSIVKDSNYIPPGEGLFPRTRRSSSLCEAFVARRQ